jgi:hypothetical protein
MALYQAPAGRKTFDDDVTSRGGTQWRMTGYVAEATAYDERLEKEKDLGKPAHVTEPVVGVSTLRRANSGGSEQFKLRLKEVAEANENVPRRFIRTWVRILPRTSVEVKEAGFQVT